MLLLQCDGCKTTATTDCACPDEAAALPGHLDGCPLTDLGAQLQCSCCPQDHSHDQAAISCPADHSGQPCPAPSACKSWSGMVRDVANLDPENPRHAAVKAELECMYGKPIEGDCPGGHCGIGVAGCTVCRTMTVTLIGGPVLKLSSNTPQLVQATVMTGA